MTLPESVVNTAPDPGIPDGGTGDAASSLDNSESIVSDTPDWVTEYLIASGQVDAPVVATPSENPPWLCAHIDEKDPNCPDPQYSDHYCDECNYWQEAWKEEIFPGKMIQPRSGIGPDLGVYGHNSFTNLCGMWCTPEFFAECNFFDRDEQKYSLNVIEYSIAFASEILYKMSGRQYPGMCERLVYPGTDRSANKGCDMFGGRTSQSTDYGMGLLMSPCCDIGTCGSNCCGADPSVIKLPRPINNVIEIVIDGQRLDRSTYKISGDNELIRVDGKFWPQYNDLSRSPFEQVQPTLADPALKLSWLEKWALDSGSVCTSREDLKIKLRAPDWVNRFLQDNPELVQALPRSETWVNAWLGANGFALSTTGELCDVANPSSGLPSNDLICSDQTLETVCNFMLGNKPNLPGVYKWQNDVYYNKAVADIQKKGLDCPSWVIRYYQGKCPPISGQLAAAALAREIAKELCGDSCFPSNTARITAEGIDIIMISRFQSIYPHFPFGIQSVDTFLAATNPHGLQRQGSVHRASGRKSRRIRSLR